MSYREANALKVLVAHLRHEMPGVTLGTTRNPNGGSESDHNPWLKDANGTGVVRAVDVMTTNGTVLAENLAAKLGRHPAMKSGAYVIWNHRIISADRKSEGWRPYSGASPHTDHVHVSITTEQRGYDSTASWGSLTKGSGNLGGIQAAAPPVGTVGTGGLGVKDAYNAHATGTGAGAVGSAANAANAAVSSVLPDADVLRQLVIYGLALFGGVALIAVGMAKTVRPHAKALEDDVRGAALDLIPQGRAAKAGAAATATKGV